MQTATDLIAEAARKPSLDELMARASLTAGERRELIALWRERRASADLKKAAKESENTSEEPVAAEA